jgi:hypothetical protein
MQMVQDMLPAAMKPSASRLFADCNRKIFQKTAWGTYMTQQQVFNGSLTLQIPYNFTCSSFYCYNFSMPNADFDVIYYRPFDNILILYNCIEITDMIQALALNLTPFLV